MLIHYKPLSKTLFFQYYRAYFIEIRLFLECYFSNDLALSISDILSYIFKHQFCIAQNENNPDILSRRFWIRLESHPANSVHPVLCVGNILSLNKLILENYLTSAKRTNALHHVSICLHKWRNSHFFYASIRHLHFYLLFITGHLRFYL